VRRLGRADEVEDDTRGRVFALYDAVFNVGYVVAVAAAALLSPPDGRSPLLLVLAAACYFVGLGVHRAAAPPPHPAHQGARRVSNDQRQHRAHAAPHPVTPLPRESGFLSG